MRYALIIAGGSGTRLWPMSTRNLPKQLIPFLDGKSLLQIAMDRLKGILPDEQILICAGEAHRDLILQSVSGTANERFYGEPMGRDTLNAVGLVAADLSLRDPEAVMAVFTADHIIEPIDVFQKTVEQGFSVAEWNRPTLVTFGIQPSHAATGYGYLKLGQSLDDAVGFFVEQFKEKPDIRTAEHYFDAGPQQYLWNSGMFVWRAAILMDCIKRYAPRNYEGLARLGQAYQTDARREVLGEVYPTLPKISVDFAIMEPASQDPEVRVAAVPMPLNWLDLGSWQSFALTRPKDQDGNPETGCTSVLLDTTHTLVLSSDPDHLIATIGCDDYIVIHTSKATLICPSDRAEQLKELHGMIKDRFGDQFV